MVQGAKAKVMNSLLTVRQQFHPFTKIDLHNPISVHGKLWSAVLSGSSCTADSTTEHLQVEWSLVNTSSWSKGSEQTEIIYGISTFVFLVMRSLSDMSGHVLNKASTIPKGAHLGVPARSWGLTPSYEHHLCHPRNEVTWTEEVQSTGTWTSQTDLSSPQ